MKKFFALFFVIALSITLCSCGACTAHVDADGDLKCDNCEAQLECTDHIDTSTDGSYKCDKCGTVLPCYSHVNKDNDLLCDECGTRLDCRRHVDNNDDNECDKCFEFVPCQTHIDEDDNLTCDKCNERINCSEHIDEDTDNFCDNCYSKLPCTVHHDANDDIRCDKCGAKLPCTSHRDNNRDLSCDKCGAPVNCTHIDENNDSVCDVEKCKWNYDHTHTYSSIWSSDSEKHWHSPSCNHTIPNADEVAHIDEDNNGMCDVCGYKMCQHAESEAEGWCSDASGHWRPLTCGHNAKPDASKVSAHNFDLDGLCECGYKINHVHTYESTWSTTATEHYLKSTCGHDTEESERGFHIDVEVYDGICDTCGYVMCDHPYKTEWSINSSTHWLDPKCDHVEAKNVGEHIDSNNDGRCDICDWDYDHVHEYNWIIDANVHKKNLICGHVIEDLQEEAHVDADEDVICDVCGYNYNHDHTFSSEWSANETHHWHTIIGNCAIQHPHITDSYAPHTDSDGNLICDVCGVFYESSESKLPDDNIIETPKFEK